MVLGVIIIGVIAVIIIVIVIKLIQGPNKTNHFKKTNCITCGRKTNSLICTFCKKDSKSLR